MDKVNPTGLGPMGGVREQAQHEAERYGKGVLEGGRYGDAARAKREEWGEWGEWESPGGGPHDYGEYKDLDWLFGSVDWVNGWAMHFTGRYWWSILAALLFTGGLFRMVPIQMHYSHSFSQVLLVYVRKMVFWGVTGLVGYPVVVWLLYVSIPEAGTPRTTEIFWDWAGGILSSGWPVAVYALAGGILANLVFARYVYPAWSASMRKIRVRQYYDSQSDIRRESRRFKAKQFRPRRYYRDGKVFVGLDEHNQAIHVKLETWRETNMQIIGPTRFGKGIILGALMDQAIRRGDGLVYIDPKNDRFAPHILHQACAETGRPFYYLTLHDGDVGSWEPFAGGPVRDGLSRLELTFGLELTGEPGSDYYKSQERRILEQKFAECRGIDRLYRAMERNQKEGSRILAELEHWRAVRSLCPEQGTGLSIAEALKENAVVYVQGHLFDSVVKGATKAFIVELIQESRRLVHERSAHLTVAVDEVSFLTSRPLAQALATSVGFQCNFILAYQSQNDLLNLEDRGINAKYIYQSINVNSQLKAVYAGADRETAEWASGLSGTIVKDITKMERTEINEAGGEGFEKQRMLGAQEENFIHSNQILALPPKVFVFFQPAHLAKIGFCSFVPVKDENRLTKIIEKEREAEQARRAMMEGQGGPEEREIGRPGHQGEDARGPSEDGGRVSASEGGRSRAGAKRKGDTGGTGASRRKWGKLPIGNDASAGAGAGKIADRQFPGMEAGGGWDGQEMEVGASSVESPGRDGHVEGEDGERREAVRRGRETGESRRRQQDSETVTQMGSLAHPGGGEDESINVNVADDSMPGSG